MEQRNDRENRPLPDYEKLHVWECYMKELDVEYRQSVEEGKDIEAYKPLFDAVIALKNDENKELLSDVLYKIVREAPQRADYPYDEPSDLAGIRAARKAHDLPLVLPGDEELLDRVAGAWYGRICGCLLGKPVEGIMSEELKKILVRTNNYPMTRYIDREEITPEVLEGLSWEIDKWAYPRDLGRMPPDDDTNYMLIALRILERCGKDFTPEDMAKLWLSCQVKNAYCTAERVAYRNFVAGYLPPDSASYKNPYREWIGAQIRADVFGYVFPCEPEKAAEAAFKDACISHVKNGIYGEMWAAATIASAFGTDDPEEAILRGLAEVPERSRLYEAVTATVKKHRDGVPVEEVFADIHRRWDERNGHDWTHTVSNAEIVTAALLYGEKDYARSVGMAVMTGFDTDCNGATVGSILGALLGYGALPREFTDRIRDTLDSNVIGWGRVSVKEMAKRTFALIKK